MEKDAPNVPAAMRDRIGVTGVNVKQSDIISVSKSQLRTLQREIRAALPRTTDPLSKMHLEDCLDRIDLILNPR
jgi:hypothetical protein